MECRGQTDGIPKLWRVFKVPSKLQIKLEVRLETELNLWRSAGLDVLWVCVGKVQYSALALRKNDNTKKGKKKKPTKNQPIPTFKAEICINLHGFPWLEHSCRGWRALPGQLQMPCDILSTLFVSAQGIRGREEFSS